MGKEEVEVYFPYNAYGVQRHYVSSAVKAVLNGENALLESPTGTGKTLCLLTATLAALRHLQTTQGSNSRIIYCSRIFTQLSQVSSEILKTAYVPKGVTISSKNNLCFNKKLIDNKLKGPALKVACQEERRTNSCKLFQAHRGYKQQVDYPQDSFAIEDLAEISNKINHCPYYQNRAAKNNADIIFSPYQYVLSKTIRERMKFDLKDAILIFDEAHNVSQAAESAMSLEISTQVLLLAIKELKSLKQKINE